MATGTRARKSKQQKENSAASLLEAIKFINEAQLKEGQPHQTHCLLSNKWAIAYNGTMLIGSKIEEEICACPHTETLLKALAQCGNTMHITQLASGRLSIKSDKLKALVPCYTEGDLPTLHMQPDAPIAPIDDRLKKALEITASIPNYKKGERIFERSVLINGPTTVGTNGHVIIEYWHGIDLPPDVALPLEACAAILSTEKKLAKFGYSGSSCTFWFEDESFIKTQLYVEKWPFYSQMFERRVSPWPLPPNFFEAVEALMPFTNEQGYLHFKKGIMQTAKYADEGSTYEVEGLPEGPVFDGKLLKLIQNYVEKIDFNSQHGELKYERAFFFGENLRGIICAILDKEK
jgi:hypothetical protein